MWTTYTIYWPWKSMLWDSNSFFQHPWVIFTTLLTRMYIRKPLVMVACAHNIGCNSVLPTPIRLASICRRPSTNMSLINSSYAFLLNDTNYLYTTSLSVNERRQYNNMCEQFTNRTICFLWSWSLTTHVCQQH